MFQPIVNSNDVPTHWLCNFALNAMHASAIVFEKKICVYLPSLDFHAIITYLGISIAQHIWW
jgi:hypothetical protein